MSSSTRTNGAHPPRKPRVYLSSKPNGDAEMQQHHEKALGQFYKNFTLLNRNGEDSFSLTDMHDKIVASQPDDPAPDAYVFLPFPNKHFKEAGKRVLFREMFKAASLFVGLQTSDPDLRLRPGDKKSPPKPIVLINHDGCYQPFYDLAMQLHEQGTIGWHPDNYLRMVGSVDKAVHALQEAFKVEQDSGKREHPQKHSFSEGNIRSRQTDPKGEHQPGFNVCVFCSASTKDTKLTGMARDLGGRIAEEGWGVVSGMGRTGMMGAVVGGAARVIERQKAEGSRVRGWVGGSNLMRIINMEGVPDYYDTMWLEKDIYRRMDVMIDKSDAFLIMPGGMGTVQEFMALLLLKHPGKGNGSNAEYRMHKKPIIVVNPPYTHGGKTRPFWDGLIKLARAYGFEDDFEVVSSVDEAMERLEHYQKPRLAWKARASQSRNRGESIALS